MKKFTMSDKSIVITQTVSPEIIKKSNTILMIQIVKIILLALLIALSYSVFAQQDPMYTQYMTNPVTVNPAFAGTRECANLAFAYRKQWVGLDGSPSTGSITYNTSMNQNKVGVGGSIIFDKIGPVLQTGAYFDYSYHLKFSQSKKLSFGLMGGFNYYTFDLTNLRMNEADNDINITDQTSKFLPNFGVGAFYYTPKFFAGVSVPKLLRNSLEKTSGTLTTESKEERHLFLMTGAIFDVSDNIKFKPSLVSRFVNGSPASIEGSATVMLYDKIWLGLMYRYGDAVGGLVRWQINPQTHLGYSYDYTYSRLKHFNSGSHEIFISFDFLPKDRKTAVPRFF